MGHSLLLVAALVLVRTAIPDAPPEPATMEMAFLAPPAPARPVAEPARQPAAPEPQPTPEPTPEPPAPAIQPQPVEAPLAWQPMHTSEYPAPAKPKQIAGRPPAKPAVSAEAATPGPPAPSPASAPHAEEVHAAPIDGGWMQAVGAWLAAHKKYPDEARQRGEEGRLAVRFTMDRSGQVTAVQVVRGSGSEALDQAAVTMLRDAKLPPLPAAMPQPTITVTVQIRFALGP